MSQPPVPPHDAPPPDQPPGGGVGPYGPPPGPVGPYRPPSSGMSKRGKFWLGAVLAIPAVIAAVTLFAMATTVVTSLTENTAAQGAVAIGCLVVLLGCWITLVVIERTRMIALGILAGTAIVTVVLGGACVALIAAVNGTV